MNTTIFGQIRSEADNFYNNSIEVVPGYTFNQYDTIKRIHLYTNSKFEGSGKFLGRDLLFYNVVNPPCEVATKMIDLDVKNIRLRPLNESSYWKTFLLEKELRVWMKKSKYGVILNEISRNLPRYGSAVVQKTKDSAKVIDLRRLILDPTVSNIQNSRFVTVVHYMTPDEMRDQSWDKNLVEDAIARFGQTEAPQSYEKDGQVNEIKSAPYVKVYERYGFWNEGKENGDWKLWLHIVAEPYSQSKNEKGEVIGENGIVLFSSRWTKEMPFKDFHYDTTKGRWLGTGVVEKLFDVQVRMNEIKNQQRIAMEISATPMFNTQDKTIVRNVLTDMRPGDLIVSKQPITPIANENRNIQFFQVEEQSYRNQADKLTFSYDTVRGETPSASTPATNAVLANNQATGVFGFKRQDFDLALQDFFNTWVTPQLITDLTPEHIFRFAGEGDDLLKIDKTLATRYAGEQTVKNLLQNGNTSMEQWQADYDSYVNKLQAKGAERFFKVKEGWYKDAEFDFDYVITNEQVDPQILISNLPAVISALSQPGALDNPMTRQLIYKYAETLGINPTMIEINRQEQGQMQPQQLQAPLAQNNAKPQQVL